MKQVVVGFTLILKGKSAVGNMVQVFQPFKVRYSNSIHKSHYLSLHFPRKELSQLLSLDQLNTARANGDAFSELDEEEPKFAPTYKFRLGTSEYDFKRAPAWWVQRTSESIIH